MSIAYDLPKKYSANQEHLVKFSMQMPMTQCASVAVWPVLLLFTLYCLVFALPYSDWCRCFSGCTNSFIQHIVGLLPSPSALHFIFHSLPNNNHLSHSSNHQPASQQMPPHYFFIIIIPLWLFIGTEGRTRLHQIQPLPAVGGPKWKKYILLETTTTTTAAA